MTKETQDPNVPNERHKEIDHLKTIIIYSYSNVKSILISTNLLQAGANIINLPVNQFLES